MTLLTIIKLLSDWVRIRIRAAWPWIPSPFHRPIHHPKDGEHVYPISAGTEKQHLTQQEDPGPCESNVFPARRVVMESPASQLWRLRCGHMGSSAERPTAAGAWITVWSPRVRGRCEPQLLWRWSNSISICVPSMSLWLTPPAVLCEGAQSLPLS